MLSGREGGGGGGCGMVVGWGVGWGGGGGRAFRWRANNFTSSSSYHCSSLKNCWKEV